jgi:hypothetical protein
MPPPRTLKPVAPSPTVLTPGSSCTARTTSASPSRAGTSLMARASSRVTPTSVLRTFWSGALPSTTTSAVSTPFVPSFTECTRLPVRSRVSSVGA